MLKFFRKIRQQLLQENSFQKYLLYAIGEILLVMVGILLALQINNWNENRKDRAAELIALIDLKEEFETNRDNLNNLLNYKIERTQLWKDYLEIVSDQNRSLEERGMQRPIPGARKFEFSHSTLNSILSSGKIDKIGNDTLKYLLATWMDKINKFNQISTLHVEFFQNRLRPYEYQFASLEVYKNTGIVNPFLSKKDINKINGKAVQNLTYQNLLLSNYNWLKLQVKDGETVLNGFQQTIQLLKEEIKSKQS